MALIKKLSLMSLQQILCTFCLSVQNQKLCLQKHMKRRLTVLPAQILQLPPHRINQILCLPLPDLILQTQLKIMSQILSFFVAGKPQFLITSLGLHSHQDRLPNRGNQNSSQVSPPVQPGRIHYIHHLTHAVFKILRTKRLLGKLQKIPVSSHLELHISPGAGLYRKDLLLRLVQLLVAQMMVLYFQANRILCL